MKRAKFMLLAIAVLATVGGALAFKAQTMGTKKFCYLTTDTQPAVGACLDNIVDRTERLKQSSDPTIFYTTTNDITKCNLAACPNIGVLDQQ